MFEQGERFPAWKRFLLGSFLMIVVAAAVASLAAFGQRQDLAAAFAERPEPGVDPVLKEVVSGPRTILLIGSDRRKEDKKFGVPPRSDTMMLLRLDPDLQTTNILSLPRDLKVEIPGHGERKINESYGLGGSKLVVKTITAATGIHINHVVNINFAGFRRAVDEIGCVYTDIDRRYFNDNVGRYYGEAFATIDVKAGYQKLCGQKALDYVRFRHYDSDIHRGARQQSFLRQAKQQVGVAELFQSARKLKNIVADNVRTDSKLANGRTLQKVLGLGINSANKPVYQVQIPRLQLGEVFVEASESSMRKAARIFMEGPDLKGSAAATGDGTADGSAAGKRRKKKKRQKSVKAKGIIADKVEGRQQGAMAGLNIKLPVMYPTVRVSGSRYATPRSYRITTPDGDRVSAYRIVVETREIGEYYGIQGINWDDPPILRNPSEERKIGGRTYKLYYEGNKLGMVAYQKDGRSYWVANTLLRHLTERQMLAVAASLRTRK